MRAAVFLSAVLALVIWSGADQARATPAVTSESPGCGYPRFYLPEAGRSGDLPGDFPVRGPAGALFGRTLEAVSGQLVWWTVPMSDGVRVRVHRRLLPVLEDVEDNLLRSAASGLQYRALANQTWGHRARTSVSHEGLSYHGVGAAVDINASSNPYRRDGDLITDMPAWYVAAWEAAGMCWGGSWNGVKDPMHFSWVGPGPSPAYEVIPDPVPPLTDPDDFDTEAGRHQVVFGRNHNFQAVTDATGDGAPDVAHLRPWDDRNHVLEVAASQLGYGDCAVWRWWLGEIPSGEPVLADVEGVGRPDLLFLDESGASLRMDRYSVAHGYVPVSDIATAVPSDGRYTFGDADHDGADDLWAVRSSPDGVEITIWTAASSYTEKLASGEIVGLALGPHSRLATADRDVDGRADLLVVEPAGQASEVAVVSAADLDSPAETISAPALSNGDLVGFEEYDGDGRPDLQIFGAGGLEVWLGNQPLDGYSHTSWFLPDGFQCDDETTPYFHDRPFADDDDSQFQSDIEWLAARNITRGCNPPFEDRFCPDDAVTRGQMAAFLQRALALPPAENGFVDDDGTVFEADIGALAAAGITRGCNPPDNDEFCPNQHITRGQMAAFLTRALGLPAAASPFTDDDASIFEADIAALAASGITRGCNPPANDRFCPDQEVTRGQMAAFLHRAEAMLPR